MKKAPGRIILLVLHLTFITHYIGFGQAASPYSRYGLGYVRSTAFSANAGMGGVSAAYGSLLHINYTNPASYASLTRTTLEIGANFDGLSIKAKDSVYRAAAGNLNHLAIAFVPKPDKWALSIGLLPYTNINYTFAQNINDPNVGSYRNVYAGKGSLYQLYAGGAYKFKSRINERDNFSVGANLSYVFGKLDYQKVISFPDSVNAYSTRNITNVNTHMFNYTAGFQYRRRIYHNNDNPDERTDIFMTLGAYGTGGIKMNAKVSNYWDRFEMVSGFGAVTVDTQQSVFDQKYKLNMPFTIGAGFMFGNERFWLAGADFTYSNWSAFTSPLQNAGLNDSWRASVGFQITPKYDDRNYFNKVQYRLGAYAGKSQFNYQGKSLTEAAGTIGLGFPFKSLARLNLTGDFGTRTPGTDVGISETFYRVTFGFVLNDIWFIKRKYD
ncbi:MAG: hypothetical protein KIS94_08165 [Chitinophagales bacterium]|nr:hypothetical protein [Chitinophagales bacterium]